VRVGTSAVIALLSLAVLSGCGDDDKGKESITLYAGAGLRTAIDELSAAFEAKTGIAVIVDFAGSGMLITRAREDDAVDLFMPGDVWYLDRLQELTGKVASKTDVSWFVPVILVKKGNPKHITTLADFYRDDVRVALGNPKACQVGRITATILKKHGLKREDLGTVKESLTVNELGVWVKMDDVDVTIVWDAIAANTAESTDIVSIPKEKNVISHVVVGLMKTSQKTESAQRFIDFVTSDEGRAILKKRGYRTEAP